MGLDKPGVVFIKTEKKLMTVPVVLAIAGVVSIFLSIWGGGIKAKEVEIPPASSRARNIIGVIGLVFIGISIWLSTPGKPASQNIAVTPSLVPELPASTITPNPTATSSAEAVISRNKVSEWSFGETTINNVVYCLNESERLIARTIPFEQGDTIPVGVLLTASFHAEGGVDWKQFPLLPICFNDGWGLFESVGEFEAVTAGSYRLIIP